jgi:hypothetical protein
MKPVPQWTPPGLHLANNLLLSSVNVMSSCEETSNRESELSVKLRVCEENVILRFGSGMRFASAPMFFLSASSSCWEIFRAPGLIPAPRRHRPGIRSLRG